jgi:hypothetical protein
VACTGSEFCRYAIVETKERAVKWARFLDEQLAGEQVGAVPVPGGRSGPKEDAGVIRMHFSGCSASCAQPQIADIGFRGEVAHVGNHLAEAVDIGMGGSLGAEPGFIDWIEHARPVNDVPDALLRVVRRYQSERREDEPFYNWARRVPGDELRQTLAEDGTGIPGTPVTLVTDRVPATKRSPAGVRSKRAPADATKQKASAPPATKSKGSPAGADKTKSVSAATKSKGSPARAAKKPAVSAGAGAPTARRATKPARASATAGRATRAGTGDKERR